LGIWILTHGDADGICSGAIALAANPEAQVFFTHPYGLLEDLSVAEDTDTVIICDIALSEAHIDGIIERFSKIAEKGSLTYIDHHPLPEGIIEDDIPGRVVHKLGSSASELTYTLFRSKLDFMHTRVAIYGAIGDYLDNTPTVQKLLKSWDKRTLYFETGILIQGIECLKRDYDSKRRIVSNLADNIPPSLDDELVELAIKYTRREEEAVKDLREKAQIEGLIAYIIDYPFSLGKTATYVMGLTKRLVGIAGETRKKMIDMSLRTHDERINLNKLLRMIAPKLGGSGGGHPMAAGARIPKDNFEEFLKELNAHLENLRYP